jgi:hypothetical protein
MRPTHLSGFQALSAEVYMQLLRLYPKTYRQKYAVDMQRTFIDCCRAAFQEGGSIGLFKVWLPTLADLGLTVIEKHLDEGLLSSGATMIRAISLVMLGCATLLFAVSWNMGIGFMLLAMVLLIVGALGLFFTSPQGSAIIKRKLSLSDDAVQPLSESQGPQRRQETRGDIIVNKVGRGFWLRWMSASDMGLVVGFALYFQLVVGFASELSFGLQTLISIAGGIFLGASIGLAQWLVLRKQISWPGQWIIASTAGGAVGGTVALIAGEITGEVTDAGFYGALAVGAAVIGISLGIAEWLVLRRYVSQAGWWVLASTVGIVVAIGLSNVLGQALHSVILSIVGDDIARFLAMLIFGGLLLMGYGGITGAVLVWLLRQTVPI